LAPRQAGQQLLEALRPGDHLFMPGTDLGFRLMEIQRYLEDWLDQGIRVHLLYVLERGGIDTSTPEVGRFLLQVLTACIDIRRSYRREQWKPRKPGKATNHAGYGYRHRGARSWKVRVAEANENAALARIVAWRDHERLSWAKIATRRMGQGIFTKDSREWSEDRCRRAYQAEVKQWSQTNGLRRPLPACSLRTARRQSRILDGTSRAAAGDRRIRALRLPSQLFEPLAQFLRLGQDLFRLLSRVARPVLSLLAVLGRLPLASLRWLLASRLAPVLSQPPGQDARVPRHEQMARIKTSRLPTGMAHASPSARRTAAPDTQAQDVHPPHPAGKPNPTIPLPVLASLPQPAAAFGIDPATLS